ncbi:MAG: PSD1 and planctomycete cytochrome C domain-containing protein, partial [Planctomycetota bacterium]|nr:PSD1 and planctomycete cytochrome C domain-containing protein [Planctomycetota bacterium]
MQRVGKNRSPGLPVVFLAAALGWMSLGTAGWAQKIIYNRDVRPILAENCFSCHGFDQKTREAGLRLDTSDGATAVLESGNAAIHPGKPDESDLVLRIFSDDHDTLMPPPESGKQLTPEQKHILKAWIAQGAEYQEHWAFISPQKHAPPVVAASDLIQHNAIDAFVQDRLKQSGLAPSPAADPVTLIRRVSLDLTGLPPSIEDVDEFLTAFAQNPEDAYSQLVDRLLKSPHYGERWGRWWLDQARYADSNGYSVDAPRSIWKYRDWVVDALNEDKPFDQFTIEQLAGDLLPNATVAQQVATGFHRNTPINQEGGIDPEQFRIDSVFDRVATTGTVWLGLTIGCCQCHDHKFDPIKHDEYYQFFAFFNQQDEPGLTVYPQGVDPSALNAEKKQVEATLIKVMNDFANDLDEWESELTEPQRKQLSKDVQKALATDKKKRNASQRIEIFSESPCGNDQEFVRQRERVRQIEKLLASGVPTFVMKEQAKPRTTTVFIKGDFTRPDKKVTCGTPAVLPPLSATDKPVNRLDLAQWIASPGNPLTARVIVNRVWQQYFGRGLVETENDFGLQGSPPSHPELLDWLALDFIEHGWSLKELHRRIVMSHTYRQASRDRTDLKSKDPGNYLLARQRRLRLDAEIVRDVALSASGLLSSKLGGPPVYPPIPVGVMSQGQVRRDWKVSEGEDRYRRGLYTFIYRATPPPELNVFDAPDGQSSCTRRIRSNTPLQALTLLNDAGFFEFAQALAKIIERHGLEVAFQRCTCRPPKPKELEVLSGLEPMNAARVLLNLDE